MKSFGRPNSASIVDVSADADAGVATLVESGVRDARGKADVLLPLVERFLPHLLRTSVARDHIMCLLHQSRGASFPLQRRDENHWRSFSRYGDCQRAVFSLKNCVSHSRAAASVKKRRRVTGRGLTAYAKSATNQRSREGHDEARQQGALSWKESMLNIGLGMELVLS